jgi:hypothetical protein
MYAKVLKASVDVEIKKINIFLPPAKVGRTEMGLEGCLVPI